MAAGAIPMSEFFAPTTGESAGDVLTQIVPVVVDNILTIFAAGILNGLGKRKNRLKNFPGDGEMLRVKKENDQINLKAETRPSWYFPKKIRRNNP